MSRSSLPCDAVIQRRYSFAPFGRCRPAPSSRPSRFAGALATLSLSRATVVASARRERLHHVVDGALLEGGDRVLVVGGDEDDVALAARLLRDFEAGHARHLDVEEQDVGRVLVERAQRLDAVLGLGADGELRPQLRERLAELVAQHRLVFGDHGLYSPHAPRSPLAVRHYSHDSPCRSAAGLRRH